MFCHIDAYGKNTEEESVTEQKKSFSSSSSVHVCEWGKGGWGQDKMLLLDKTVHHYGTTINYKN